MSLIFANGRILDVVEDDFCREYRSLRAGFASDGLVRIGVSRHFQNVENNEATLEVLREFASIRVSREQAREFAQLLLDLVS